MTRRLSYRCRQQARPSTTTTCRGEMFQVRSLGQSSRGKDLNFGDTEISLQHSVGQMEESLRAKNQLDSSSRFDTIPACEEQT